MSGEYVAAGASAVSQGTGTVMDILGQLEAERLRESALDAARRTPLLELSDDDYGFLNYLGDFDPQEFDTPEAAAYQTVNEDPAARNIEMQALQRLIAAGNGAADARGAADRFAALDDANQMAKAREGAIQQRMERTGQGGAGLNAVLQAQSAQMGANRARAGTMDAVSKAALEKLVALGNAGGAANRMRGADFNVSRFNADTVNESNRFNTAARNRIREMNTQQTNTAGLRNINTRQDISGRNTAIGNSNIDRRTNNAVLENNAAARRVGNVMGALGGSAQQASNSGNVYNQLGQQTGQMFTNIGSGISAAQNANPKPPQQQQEEEYDEEWL